MSYNVVIRIASLTALLLAAALPLFAQPSAHAQSGADDPPAVTIGPDQDREFEKRAQSLETQLICPICPGETLDQSFVQISQDMKRILREKLLEGQNEDQIKDFFVARYGNSVLAAPPRAGFNLVTWVIPPIAVVLGVVVLLMVMRQMRRGATNPVAAGVGSPIAPTDGDLTDYLAEVDRDLALDQPGSDQDQPDSKSTGA